MDKKADEITLKEHVEAMTRAVPESRGTAWVGGISAGHCFGRWRN